MTEEVEEWRPVLSHPGRYEVSSLGRVRTVARWQSRGVCPRFVPSAILATAPGGRTGQYLRVMLHDPHPATSRRFVYVHTLVAEAFLGPRPFPGAVALHRNDDSTCNRADCLRWGDRDENEMDRHVCRVAPELEPAPF